MSTTPTPSLDFLTKDQLDYLAEYTRHIMATEWAIKSLDAKDGDYTIPASMPFLFAKSKGWVGAKGQVTGAGFKVAAAYLRR